MNGVDAATDPEGRDPLHPFPLPAALTALLILFCGPVAAQSYPPPVARLIAEARELCDGLGRFRVNHGGIARVDVFGRGKRDFVVSGDSFECDGAASIYGRSGGSDHTIVSDIDGAMRIVFQTLAHEVKVVGRGLISISYHGSACGRTGADACVKRQRWDGRKFILAR